MTVLFRAPRLRDPRVVPIEPVEIDWAHPLAVFGISGLWLLNGSNADLSPNDNALVFNSGCSFRAGPAGPALLVSGTNSNFASTFPVGITGSQDRTLTAWYMPFAGGYYANLVALGSSAGYNAKFGLTNRDSNNTLQIDLYGSSIGGFAGILNQWYHLAAVQLAGTCYFYVNGVLNTSNAATLSTTNAPLTSGSNPNQFGNDWSGQLGAVTVWPWGLTSDQIAETYAEPFAMLRPIARRRYYGVAAASSIAIGTSESAPASDTLALGVTCAAGIADIVAAADTPSIAPAIAAAESAAASDRTAVVARATLAETALAADGIGAAAQTAIADSVAASDATALAVTAPLAVAESVAVADSTAIGTGIAVAETNGAADAPALAADPAIGTAESALATDSVGVGTGGIIPLAIAERAAPVDGFRLGARVFPTLAETAAAADQRALGSAIALADTVLALDTLGLPTGFLLALAEGVGATDLPGGAMLAPVACADAAAAADAPALASGAGSAPNLTVVFGSNPLTVQFPANLPTARF